MPISVRTIEHFRACAKAVNHGVQKVIGESEADSFLFAAEHTEVLLGVAFHVNLGELYVALSWLVQNLNTLHAVKTEGDSGAKSPDFNILFPLLRKLIPLHPFISHLCSLWLHVAGKPVDWHRFHKSVYQFYCL